MGIASSCGSRSEARLTTWIILAGLPGAGKSTLARALSVRLGGVILDKDRVREALFPDALTDYTREQDDLCMRAIYEAAVYLSRQGLNGQGMAAYVFLDGRTFSRREQIEEAVHAAEQAGAVCRILHVVCADDVAEARLSAQDPTHPARNRDAHLYRMVKNRFEEIARPHATVDTTNGVEPILDTAAAYAAHGE